MRKPSARVLRNRVAHYPQTPGQDADGGYQPTYGSASEVDVPCSVQYRGTAEMVDDQMRVSVVNEYHIIYAFSPGLSPRDKVVWADDTGLIRTFFVQSNPPSEAGRDSAVVLRCIERI